MFVLLSILVIAPAAIRTSVSWLDKRACAFVRNQISKMAKRKSSFSSLDLWLTRQNAVVNVDHEADDVNTLCTVNVDHETQTETGGERCNNLAVDVDPVLPRITTPGRGDVGPDHMQTEEDSTIPSSVPVSSAQSSANIPSVKGDFHNYHHVFYIPTITMRILKYVDPEDLPKISQISAYPNQNFCKL
ncbi:uncharacterized protein LOC122961250 [Acropora millepora]|uniref:uncharacterized protein LOC122961250 n=1 Tax=Acropora millepora TaxID=45264 RepID=UPI001CF3AFD1|nr:uncharacterized protein LOC122961250 [Acropora millepora]